MVENWLVNSKLGWQYISLASENLYFFSVWIYRKGVVFFLVKNKIKRGSISVWNVVKVIKEKKEKMPHQISDEMIWLWLCERTCLKLKFKNNFFKTKIIIKEYLNSWKLWFGSNEHHIFPLLNLNVNISNNLKKFTVPYGV